MPLVITNVYLKKILLFPQMTEIPNITLQLRKIIIKEIS